MNDRLPLSNHPPEPLLVILFWLLFFTELSFVLSINCHVGPLVKAAVVQLGQLLSVGNQDFNI